MISSRHLACAVLALSLGLPGCVQDFLGGSLYPDDGWYGGAYSPYATGYPYASSYYAEPVYVQQPRVVYRAAPQPPPCPREDRDRRGHRAHHGPRRHEAGRDERHVRHESAWRGGEGGDPRHRIHEGAVPQAGGAFMQQPARHERPAFAGERNPGQGRGGREPGGVSGHKAREAERGARPGPERRTGPQQRPRP